MTVKSFSATDNTQLTEHFNAREFRCKCGKSHDFLISDELVSKLEQLYAALDCGKIIVNSGYRCPEHDKAVGGTSTGQHTKGTAADVVCYDKSGSVISAKTVCCKAQDLGFSGIANITSAYTSVHLDVRTEANGMVMKPKAQTRWRAISIAISALRKHSRSRLKLWQKGLMFPSIKV